MRSANWPVFKLLKFAIRVILLSFLLLDFKNLYYFCENRIIIREIFTQTAINRHTAGAVNSPDL